MGRVLWLDVALDLQSVRGLSSAEALGRSCHRQPMECPQVCGWFFDSNTMARLYGIGSGSVYVSGASVLDAIDLENGQGAVHLGLGAGCDPGDERDVHLLHAVCLVRFSDVHRIGGLFRSA